MRDAPARARRSTRRAINGVLTLMLALLPAATWMAGSHGALSAQASRAPQYACPMHPDVRTDAPGVCPRCGMKLVLGGAVSNARYALEVVTRPRPAVAASTLRLQLLVRQTETGEVVQNFAEVHERLLHLFVVSDDLSYFDHIHPELQKDGTLQVDTTLPHDGRYQLYADFVPQGGTPQFLAYTLYTAGPVPDPARARPRLQLEVGPQRTADSLVELQLPPAYGLVAGELQAFRLHVKDAASGAPATDLEPFLGAPAHLLIVSDDLIDAFHSHPAVDFSTPNGPDVVFETVFPRPGLYRMWVQFQRRGRVEVVSFTVMASVAPSAR